MATVKQLEEAVNELQDQVTTLTKQIEVLSTLSGRLTKMSDTVEDLGREQVNTNKRIQSDIQRIVQRMQGL
jgi:prefoldin subunit 5